MKAGRLPKVSTVMKRALKLVTQGWTQHADEAETNGRTSYCAQGAIRMAATGNPHSRVRELKAAGETKLAKLLTDSLRTFGLSISKKCVIVWNDSRKTQSQVLAAFRRAHARALNAERTNNG